MFPIAQEYALRMRLLAMYVSMGNGYGDNGLGTDGELLMENYSKL